MRRARAVICSAVPDGPCGRWETSDRVRFCPRGGPDPHDLLLGADVQATTIGVVPALLRGLSWFRLPDPASSPVEIVYAGCCTNDALTFSSTLEEKAGAYLKPRLPMQGQASPLIGISWKMGAMCAMPLYHKSNIKAAEVRCREVEDFFRSLLSRAAKTPPRSGFSP